MKDSHSPSPKVSMAVIRRMPRYYRFISELHNEGVTRISSGELSVRMRVTASQIRQDFNYFGGFGQQGFGYHVPTLLEELRRILGIDRLKPAVLIGAGNMGRAVAAQIDFENRGFRLAAVFDVDSAVIGTVTGGLIVTDMARLEEYCDSLRPEAAILCTPRNAAKSVVERLIACGVSGFWNFTHFDISYHYPGARVENVHLGDSLMTLSYAMREKEARTR